MTDTSRITIYGSSRDMSKHAHTQTKKNLTNYFTQTTTSSSHSNEKLFRYLKDLYSKLRDADFDKSKFYPNVIITGSKKSGKSSLIEYITGMDLFPRSFFLNSNKVSTNNCLHFFPHF
jgi:ribosome biogenesis GTPase A